MLIWIFKTLELVGTFRNNHRIALKKYAHCMKSVCIGIFSGPYFPSFGLNTQRSSLSLCLESKYGGNTDQKKSEYGHFSRSGKVKDMYFFSGENSLGKRRTAEVNTRQGMFLEYFLSPLLFVVTLIPINWSLERSSRNAHFQREKRV